MPELTRRRFLQVAALSPLVAAMSKPVPWSLYEHASLPIGRARERRLIHTDDIECDGFTGTRIATVEITIDGGCRHLSAI